MRLSRKCLWGTFLPSLALTLARSRFGRSSDQDAFFPRWKTYSLAYPLSRASPSAGSSFNILRALPALIPVFSLQFAFVFLLRPSKDLRK